MPKSSGQKYKSLLVWQLLLKRTDEKHALKVEDIRDYLKTFGIEAERRSIYRDIRDMQELLALDEEMDTEDREKLGYVIERNRSHGEDGGYYVAQRPYTFEELRLLAECVNAAKFLTQAQVEHLKTLIKSFCSEHEAEELNNEVYMIGRVKTQNKYVMPSIIAVNEAIRANRQITFQYLKHTIKDREHQALRHEGAAYVVSLYHLLINDGYYYLLAYDESTQSQTRTFRLDRMKNVQVLPDAREGGEVFARIDMRTYTQRVFSMFGGNREYVNIRFTSDLLDTVIDRFGNEGEITYREDGSDHFIIHLPVEISSTFYGWLCSLSTKAEIISPPEAREGMRQFLESLQNQYRIE